MRRFVLLLPVVLVLGACSGFGSPVSSPPAPSTSSTSSTTTTVVANEITEAYLSPFSEMGPGWTELFFPYGTAPGELGLTPAGGNVLIGPAYGVQTIEGEWWFLDTANRRIAKFSEQGVFIGEQAVPDALLVDGSLDFHMPQALDIGPLVAFGVRNGGTSVMTVTETQVYESLIPEGVNWEVSDGTLIYGIGSERFQLAAWEGSVSAVEWYRARNESRFRVTVDQAEVVVELPDIGVTRVLQIRYAAQPEIEVDIEAQVESGADGTLFLLISGSPLNDPELKIGGLISIDPDGTVGRIQPVAPLFSSADPGDPSHLGIRPGTTQPWVMVVGEVGVHVYVREN